MGALLEANPYVDIILALALSWLSLKIVQALFGPLYGIPGIGAAIAKLDHAISQSLSHACGSIASGVSLAVGGALHAKARLIERSAKVFKNYGLTALTSAALVLDTRLAVHGIKALVRRLTATHDGQGARIKHLERELRGIEHKVKQLENDVSQGIGDDVLPRLRGIEKKLHRIDTQTIPAIEAADEQASSAISDLWKWVSGVATKPVSLTFAGAVAVALGALGLGGLNCNSLKRSLGSRACGLWSGLEDLLGLFVDVIAFTHVCAIIEFLSPIVSDVASPVVTALSSVGAGICQGSIGAPDTLTVPQLHLPNAADATLHLP